MTEPELMVIRSVTVSEVMDADGAVTLIVRSVGEPAHWDMLGLLSAAVESVRIDLARMFDVDEDD